MQVQSANICQLSESIVANQLIYNYKDQQSRTASNATINHQSAMIDCQEKHRKKCCMSICVGCRFLVWHHLGQNVEILWVSEQEQFMVQAMPHFAASDFDSRCQCNKTLRGPQYIQYITRYWWVGTWIYLQYLHCHFKHPVKELPSQFASNELRTLKIARMSAACQRQSLTIGWN